jgi:hypothetical protein
MTAALLSKAALAKARRKRAALGNMTKVTVSDWVQPRDPGAAIPV